MAEDEDYDIMPHKEIVKIKKELEELKKKQTTTESRNIVNQITQLKDSINDLLDIFKEAQENFKLEEKEPPHFKDLSNKLGEISHQNTRIAEGIVVVADMVKELKKKVDSTVLEKHLKPKPAFGPQPQFSQRPIPPPAFDIPPPSFNIPPPPSFDIPPPPDFTEGKPKKGLFGKLKR